MTRMKLKTIALLGIPLTAALVLVVVLLLRDDGAARDMRLRQRAELDRMIEAGRAGRESDAATALQGFRSSQRAEITSVIDPKTSRQALLKHGEKAVPVVKAAIYDPQETAALRLELIGLLADLKNPASDAVLTAIVADKALEERYRTVAIGKLMGRPLDSALLALKDILETEPSFSNRNLVLKAIGELNHPDSTALLLRAAVEEKAGAARIQAVESLGSRATQPGILDALRVRLFEDADENVRLAALASIGTAKDPGATAILAQVLENPQASDSLKKAAASWIEKRRGVRKN